MPNIVINTGNPTVADVDGTIVEWSSAATITADGNNVINVVEDGVPILTMQVSDIVSIDGAKPYGNAGDVVGQITNEAPSGGMSATEHTTAAREALSPTSKVIVFDTDLEGFFGWDGTQWIQL